MDNDLDNINDLKAEFEALSYRYRILSHIFAMVPGHVYWKDRQGVYLGCNDMQAQTLGYQHGTEIVGKTDSELPWDSDVFEDVDQMVMKTGQTVFREEPSVLRNQPVVYYSTKRPLIDPDTNETIGVIGVSFDITAFKEKQRLEAEIAMRKHMPLEAENIAMCFTHELRTPLAAIFTGLEGIMQLLPTLIQAYEIAQAEGLLDQKMSKHRLMTLKQSLLIMRKQVLFCQEIISRQLDNVKHCFIDPERFQVLSMHQIVTDALAEFPFAADADAALVKLESTRDFEFLGDDIFSRQVLWNLLKHSIDLIKTSGQGEIQISFGENAAMNLLYFRDTSQGIKPEDLSHVFENLYSTCISGTRLGLAHCKMVMRAYGGDIICRSEYGYYTEFELSFPKKFVSAAKFSPSMGAPNAH